MAVDKDTLIEAGLAAAAVLQAVFWLGHAAGALRRLENECGQVRARPAGDAPDVDPAFSALRTFPAMARLLPPDANLLVVTALPTVFEYEFWFVPRVVRLLQHFPAEWEEIARARPDLGAPLAARRAWLARRGRLFTPDSLRVELERASHVLTFFAEGLVLDSPEHVLEPIATAERARLFRVHRR